SSSSTSRTRTSSRAWRRPPPGNRRKRLPASTPTPTSLQPSRPCRLSPIAARPSRATRPERRSPRGARRSLPLGHGTLPAHDGILLEVQALFPDEQDLEEPSPRAPYLLVGVIGQAIPGGEALGRGPQPGGPSGIRFANVDESTLRH